MKTLVVNLGEITILSDVRDVVDHDHILTSLDRHAEGDWGNVSYEDKMVNEAALRNDNMLLSAYDYEGQTYYIKTNAERTVTKVTLKA
ncbi:hypothetical protein ACTWQB_16505 [Piscibacillus sp. B03]|uniref:hypothetical protein n=1 Tax=Piscibacillus sp. B03 TaxID=3457430 RepID=UPI003FCD85C6